MYDSLRLLVEDVSAEAGIPARDILGPWQHRGVSRIRQVCFALSLDVLHASAPEVGRLFSRSPNTVLDGAVRGRMLIKRDDDARRIFETVGIVHRDRFRLALIGELELMNRTIARYRRRAFVIAGLLGVDGAALDEREVAAAE
jgi:hypothetical protein